MNAPEPDLENLSISDLESLLAERRRRESKRLLRVIAGREAGAPPAASPRLRTAGLAGVEPRPRKGKATARLAPTDAASALDQAAAAPPLRPLPLPPRADRFRRGGLASLDEVRAPRGPVWLRQATTRKTIDTVLQMAEVAFVFLFVWVVAQWLFADSETDPNLGADQGPGPSAVHAAPPRATATPLRSPSVVRPVAVPSVVRTAARPTPSPTSIGHVPGLMFPRSSMMAGRIADVESHVLAPAPEQAAETSAEPDGGAPDPTADAIVQSDPALPIEIRIPKIKLDARVREVQVRLDTWEWEVADYMTGHHAGTANPGDTGNVVIAGHRDIRGKVFLNLDKLKKGDDIFLSSGRGLYHYVVRETGVVRPTQVSVMAPTKDARLTLITCTPVKIASHRLIIIADLDPSYVAPDRAP
ncbi:MAG TPA: sortase [Chloroflexia bacterium]|nr:sortase [Chloroflexia bacterium]